MKNLALNGVNGSTGEYLPGPASVDELVDRLAGAGKLRYTTEPHYDALRERHQWATQNKWDLAPGPGKFEKRTGRLLDRGPWEDV